MKRLVPLISAATFLAAFLLAAAHTSPRIDHLQGETAGEVTHNSVILQTRLTVCEREADGSVEGAPGVARFEVSTDESFQGSVKTDWLKADAGDDFILKSKVEGLSPDTLYHYRIEYGPDKNETNHGPARNFRTLPGPDISRRYTLAVVT